MSPERSERKSRRGAWKIRSPKMALIRLNCGVMANSEPVSNGEPSEGSAGYAAKTSSMSVKLVGSGKKRVRY